MGEESLLGEDDELELFDGSLPGLDVFDPPSADAVRQMSSSAVTRDNVEIVFKADIQRCQQAPFDPAVTVSLCEKSLAFLPAPTTWYGALNCHVVTSGERSSPAQLRRIQSFSAVLLEVHLVQLDA